MRSNSYDLHKQSSLLDCVRRFFGFGDQPETITIVLPSVERTRPTLKCRNYPLFPYEVSPDDVFTALRVYSMLVLLYGYRVRVRPAKELLVRPSGHCVLIGSSVTNIFSSHALKDQYYSFGPRGGEHDHDIFAQNGKRYSVLLDGDDSVPLQERGIVEDYALISKHSRQGSIEVNLAGCRAYGQMALWDILEDLDFYERVLPKVEGKDFQILIQVAVAGRTCYEWEILDIRSGPPTDIRRPQGPLARKTITWLHLSDLHFRVGSEFESNIVLDALLEDVAHLSKSGLSPDFIAVTGDIAFSGHPDDYEQASKFLDSLLHKTDLPKNRLFVVPGNHDADRSLITAGAKAIGAALTDRNSTNTLLATPNDRRLVMARFRGYAQFINDYFAGHLQFDDERYFYVQEIKVSGHRVALLGLNSAWLCASDQDKANGLLIGERQARIALKQAEDADIRIALLHHPFGWLKDFDQHDSAALLSAGCHFILHGHMHQIGAQQLVTPDSRAMIIAAGASYERREYPNCYNFVQLNTEPGKIILRRYSDTSPGFWASDTLTYKNAEDGTFVFRLSGSG